MVFDKYEKSGRKFSSKCDYLLLMVIEVAVCVC